MISDTNCRIKMVNVQNNGIERIYQYLQTSDYFQILKGLFPPRQSLTYEHLSETLDISLSTIC